LAVERTEDFVGSLLPSHHLAALQPPSAEGRVFAWRGWELPTPTHLPFAQAFFLLFFSMHLEQTGAQVFL